MGIRNSIVEKNYNIKNCDNQVTVYILSQDEIQRRYGHIGKLKIIDGTFIGYAYDGNPLKTDKGKIIIECMKAGMTAKDIIKKYGYKPSHVSKIMKKANFEKNRKSN